MILITTIKMKVTFFTLSVILSSPWPYEGDTEPPVPGEEAEARERLNNAHSHTSGALAEQSQPLQTSFGLSLSNMAVSPQLCCRDYEFLSWASLGSLARPVCLGLQKQGQPLVIPAGLDFNKALWARHKRNGSNLEINYFHYVAGSPMYCGI